MALGIRCKGLRMVQGFCPQPPGDLMQGMGGCMQWAVLGPWCWISVPVKVWQEAACCRASPLLVRRCGCRSWT